MNIQVLEQKMLSNLEGKGYSINDKIYSRIQYELNFFTENNWLNKLFLSKDIIEQIKYQFNASAYAKAEFNASLIFYALDLTCYDPIKLSLDLRDMYSYPKVEFPDLWLDYDIILNHNKLKDICNSIFINQEVVIAECSSTGFEIKIDYYRSEYSPWKICGFYRPFLSNKDMFPTPLDSKFSIKDIDTINYTTLIDLLNSEISILYHTDIILLLKKLLGASDIKADQYRKAIKYKIYPILDELKDFILLNPLTSNLNKDQKIELFNSLKKIGPRIQRKSCIIYEN